jgi:molecular chaperone DnaK
LGEGDASGTRPDGTADEPIVGIDLGTTNSLVAIGEAAGPRCLPDESGDPLVPSVVTLADGRIVVGRAARELAVDHPRTTIYSIKRLMGRKPSDLSDAERRSLPYEVVASDRDLVQVRVGDRTLAPEEISALILRELKQRASKALGREVRKAVITVPAYFDDAQRQATRLAGRLADLDVVRIVNEPTAAALAYGLDRSKSGSIVVYDLGGGTFDVSVLELRDGIFRVRATSGDTQLGGDDFDRKLMQRLLERLPAGTAPDPSLLQASKLAAERAKIELSARDRVTFGVADERSGATLESTVTRAEFEALIAPEVERTLSSCRRALSDAELSASDVRAVVLVGGSTRVPLVRRRVEEFFGRKPYTGIDPDQVVALGAAVQADILRGAHGRDMLLLDVIPLSLGIETYGGAVAKVLMRNTPIPAQASDTFTTHVANQTAIDLHVLQGERELVKDCRSLGRFRLSVTADETPAAGITVPAKIREILQTAADKRTDAQKKELAVHYRTVAPLLQKVRDELADTEKKLADYEKTIRRSLVTKAAAPRTVRVLPRGNWLDSTGEVVTPGIPAFMKALPTGDRRATRLDLAKWLVSRENPLTARVFVNRLWKMAFGTGLSKRLDDLGAQGEWPVHPELLDWLAIEFMERKWSFKALHRLIVTSATYRQSSRVSPELLAKDAENKLVARGPRVRLEAEQIRDSALKSAGMLSAKMFGPSVFPPQPPGVTTEGTYGGLNWKVSDGEDRYRRGLYTFAKRTAPHAMGGTFDAPSGEVCIARREVTNSALQALTMLNDVVLLDAARGVAKRLIEREGKTEDRVARLFVFCLSRPPTAEELARVVKFYESQRTRFAIDPERADAVGGPGPGAASERAAWTATVRVILNLDEFVTKE